MTDRAKLVAHHVGARGLNVTLDCPELFDDGIVHVLYEADAAAAQAMSDSNIRKNFLLLPHCLGREDGEGVLHITDNPYGSSLYRPNPQFSGYYGEVTPTGAARYDSIMGDWCRVVREMPVGVRSLDSLLATGEVDAALTPDFVSLDTQGSERDVLLGARNALRSTVLAVAVEMEFLPIYQGQPLASDVLSLLASEGFDFAGFLHIADEISPYRAPLGQRGRGLQAWGDALFFRRLDTLDKLAPDPEAYRLMARKLAFLSLAFGFVENGMAALRLAGGKQVGVEHILHGTAGFRYQRFLDELALAAAAMEPVYLPVHRSPPRQGGKEITPEGGIRRAWRQSSRFARNAYRRIYRSLDDRANALAGKSVRSLVLSQPIEATLLALCYGFRWFDQAVLGGRLFVDTSPFYQHRTVFERVLYNYQFHDLCRMVRSRRLRTINQMD